MILQTHFLTDATYLNIVVMFETHVVEVQLETNYTNTENGYCLLCLPVDITSTNTISKRFQCFVHFIFSLWFLAYGIRKLKS